MTTTADQQAADAAAAARYDRIIAMIQGLVAHVNETLGLRRGVGDYTSPMVTFGYIGNLGALGDDRLWMVFLPHPGRVGTDADHIGEFRTGDIHGARLALRELLGFHRALTWVRPTIEESKDHG